MKKTYITFILFCCCIFFTTGHAQSNPNILLIIADDMGVEVTPNYLPAATKAKMPNLEALMAAGVTFDNVWANPLCSPTRSTMLTGKYGFRTNVLNPQDLNTISTNEVPIHQHLTDNSVYVSSLIGKWHLGGRRDFTYPNQVGIPYYAGSFGGGVADYSDWDLIEDGQSKNESTYTTTKFTDLAIDWISAQEQPWFCWLAYNAPHTPFHLPPAHLHSQGNLSGTDNDINRNSEAYYLAMIESMDTEMGRLLNSISAEELANTMIIFIGDNGTPRRVVQDPYTRTQAKGSLYQGGIHVPMVVAGAGVSKTGERADALVNSSDIFATIADVAGTNVAAIHDSYSLKKVLEGGTASRDFAYAEIKGEDFNSGFAIRKDQYKLIDTEEYKEFYNLETDPYEQTNLLSRTLSSAEQTALRELENKVAEILASSQSAELPAEETPDMPLGFEDYPWLREVLEQQNCCANEQVTVFDYDNYSYVYVSTGADCPDSSNKLYFEDGRCWCTSTDGYCLEVYKLELASGKIIYNCDGTGAEDTDETDGTDSMNDTEDNGETHEIFTTYPWLTPLVNQNDCCKNQKIQVYGNGNYSFVYVQSSTTCSDGLGQLYFETGQPYCTDFPNYDCVLAYGLTAGHISMEWTCGMEADTDTDDMDTDNMEDTDTMNTDDDAAANCNKDCVSDQTLDSSRGACEETLTIAPQYNMAIAGATRTVSTNSIPAHKVGLFGRVRGSLNPNTISAQDNAYTITTTPVAADALTPLLRSSGAGRQGPQYSFGVLLNGVELDPVAAEPFPHEGPMSPIVNWEWNLEAINVNLGLDCNNAHVQPTGKYHYHGAPTLFLESLTVQATEMTLIGYAADGFPIYYQYAYSDAANSNSAVAEMTSSYQLKKGCRPGDGVTAPCGAYDGVYSNDYEYVAGSGTLDEANGRVGVTPEYPNGTYYYVLTTAFPSIPRYFRGTPSADFSIGRR